VAMLPDGQKCDYASERTKMRLCYWTDRNVTKVQDGQNCGYVTRRAGI